MQTSKERNIKEFIAQHPSLEVFKDGEKVKCSLSGHEMPCRLDVIQSYTNGKKYQKLRAKYDLEQEQYMQHLEPSTGRGYQPGHLYCKLTARYLSGQPQHVKRHVEGKRFKKALFRWTECQRTGEEFEPRQPLIKKNKDLAIDTEPMEEDEHQEDTQPSNDEEGSSDEDIEAENDDDDDDMADLYPSSGSDEPTRDEAMDAESDESDFDFDNLGSNVLDSQLGGTTDEPLNAKRKPVKEVNVADSKKLKTMASDGKNTKKKNKKIA